MTIIDYQVWWLKKNIKSPLNHLKSLFSGWCSFNPLLLMIQSHGHLRRQDFTVKLPRKLIDDLKATAGGIAESWFNFQVSRFFIFFWGGLLCYNLLYNTYIYNHVYIYIYSLWNIHTHIYIYIVYDIYIYIHINYSSLDHGIKQLRLI